MLLISCYFWFYSRNSFMMHSFLHLLFLPLFSPFPFLLSPKFPLHLPHFFSSPSPSHTVFSHSFLISFFVPMYCVEKRHHLCCYSFLILSYCPLQQHQIKTALACNNHLLQPMPPSHSFMFFLLFILFLHTFIDFPQQEAWSLSIFLAEDWNELTTPLHEWLKMSTHWSVIKKPAASVHPPMSLCSAWAPCSLMTGPMTHLNLVDRYAALSA